MDRFDIRELAVTLYYTATGKHDVDDHQWNVVLDSINKKLWRNAARDIGSLLQLDTPDLVANIAGGLDYSGSLYRNNENSQPLDFSNAFWTKANLTLSAPGVITGPFGTLDAFQATVTTAPGVASIANVGSAVYPGGTVDIYFKAAQGSAATFIYIQVSGGTAVWIDVFNAAVKTNGIVGSVVTVTPAPYPGFPYQVGVTSSATPTVSPTGWYRASVILPTTSTNDRTTIGLATGDGTTTTAAGNTVFLWGARRSFAGNTSFQNATSNMIDPNGVHMITAVELKYLGRYIHLDYEIPQDRYIYNIAFGQVQALIPNAYTIMGEQVILLPKTTGAQVLRVTYIPRMVDWINDNVQALNGFLPEWHHMIAYESAALMASGADPKAAAPLIAMRNDLREQWADYVISRQRQDGRKIRFVPYE